MLLNCFKISIATFFPSRPEREGEGKRYLRVYIHIRFRHARSRAQPLAWPVTLSAAGDPRTHTHIYIPVIHDLLITYLH